MREHHWIWIVAFLLFVAVALFLISFASYGTD